MPTITNIISSNNKEIDIQSNGGNLKIGTAAVATNIIIGNTTSTSSIKISSGSGNINIPSFTNTGALVSNTSGVITNVTASTTGYTLQSNGSSTLPSFQVQTGSGAITTLNGNSGSATGTVVTISGGTSGLTTSATSSTVTLGGTLVIAHGGTSVTSPTTSPTASSFVGWDTNKNISANNNIYGVTQSSANAITLTSSSTYYTSCNYAGGATITLPNPSTMALGQSYLICDTISANGSANQIRDNSGNNMNTILGPNNPLLITSVALSGITYSAWQLSTMVYGFYNDNTFFGSAAGGTFLTSGIKNTCIGVGAGNHLTTGSRNTFYGSGSGGVIATGNDNIMISFANAGVVSTQSNTLLIGYLTGTSLGYTGTAQICGINTISSASDSKIIFINSTDQLTTDSSTQLIYPTTNVTTSTVTLVPGYIYTMNDASLTTITLPTTASVGTKLVINGNGAGGWKISQISGEQIHSTAASTTSGASGSLSSGGRYDSVSLVCTVANTTWTICSKVGTLVFV